MALPTTRAEFKSYCLKRLGEPVIEINVDDDQVEDRIDEALDYWRTFHHDAIQKIPLKHQITANNITNQYIDMNPDVIAVNRIYSTQTSSVGGSQSSLFDLQYQMRLNDYLSFRVTSPVDMFLINRHFTLIDDIFSGEAPIEFNRKMNRIYPYWDWNRDVTAGDWIIIECSVQLDPDEYGLVWSDRMLIRYATALIKMQWGNNLKKYEGTRLLGGITMNGQQIYSEAVEEIKEIEEKIREEFEEPPIFITG